MPRPGASKGCSWRCGPRDGVPASALAVDDLPDGLVEPDGDRVVLTRAGRLVANEVSLRLR